MLQKGVFLYEFTADWKKLNETFPEKIKFYSN